MDTFTVLRSNTLRILPGHPKQLKSRSWGLIKSQPKRRLIDTREFEIKETK